MNVVVYPIIQTTIDWDLFLQLSQSCLKRDVTHSLDGKNKSVGDYPSFISALGELEIPDSDPDKVLLEPGALLKHLFFGFFVVAPTDDINVIRLKSDLGIATAKLQLPGYSVAIITGTLEEWRTAVINCCIERVSSSIRLIFNEILMHFERIGLHRIWLDYSKVKSKDNTFYLK